MDNIIVSMRSFPAQPDFKIDLNASSKNEADSTISRSYTSTNAKRNNRYESLGNIMSSLSPAPPSTENLDFLSNTALYSKVDKSMQKLDSAKTSKVDLTRQESNSNIKAGEGAALATKQQIPNIDKFNPSSHPNLASGLQKTAAQNLLKQNLSKDELHTNIPPPPAPLSAVPAYVGQSAKTIIPPPPPPGLKDLDFNPLTLIVAKISSIPPPPSMPHSSSFNAPKSTSLPPAAQTPTMEVVSPPLAPPPPPPPMNFSQAPPPPTMNFSQAPPPPPPMNLSQPDTPKSYPKKMSLHDQLALKYAQRAGSEIETTPNDTSSSSGGPQLNSSQLKIDVLSPIVECTY